VSLIKSIKAQLGLSVTPANNFTFDASADNGTMKLARGNAGATTQDIMVVAPDGTVTFPQNAMLGRYQAEQKAANGVVGGLNFTIPDWAKKITLLVQNLSSNGNTLYYGQLGINTPAVSGYAAQGAIGNGGGGVFTTGLPLVTNGHPANILSGVATFFLQGTGAWVYSSMLSFINGTSPPNIAAGSSPVFASPINLFRLDIGGNTFDSGYVTAICEG
jgi:hypothetical protein